MNGQQQRQRISQREAMDKGPLHEGPAGQGETRDLGNKKFSKEARDTVTEKEAGKSRGPNAG